MIDRLDKICFLPPPIDTPWTGPPPDPSGIAIGRRSGGHARIALPLFWFDPAWDYVSTRTADQIAVSVSDLGVVVSALNSDVADSNQLSEFCGGQAADPPSADSEQSTPDNAMRLRMLPYRAERYGFQPRDLAGPRIIDVRLSIARDPQGHFGYSPDRIARWEGTPADEPLAGGGWVPAASFLPDVPSLAKLDAKFEQLRRLAPQAAVFASFGVHRFRDELPAILANQPDGLILRLDDVQLSGMQLAHVTVLARQMISDSPIPETPLWIVPGPITPDDAAKLLALGASAIAIDDWCSEIIEAAVHSQPTSQSFAGYHSPGVDGTLVKQLIRSRLLPKIERFKGLCASMQLIAANQRLACLSKRWAKATGLPALAMPAAAD